jgi:hypothetical protein
MFTDCTIETNFPHIANLTGDALKQYKKTGVYWIIRGDTFLKEVYGYVPDAPYNTKNALCLIIGIGGEFATAIYPIHDLKPVDLDYVSRIQK